MSLKTGFSSECEAVGTVTPVTRDKHMVRGETERELHD